MFQSCIRAARGVALTAALLVFTAVPALAAPHGGGHGGGRGGGGHAAAHGGFHGGGGHAAAHGGFRGGVAHGAAHGGFRGGVAHGGNFHRGYVGRGYGGNRGYYNRGYYSRGYYNRGYYGYGGGYNGWPYWGGYTNYYAWPYPMDYYYPNESAIDDTLPDTLYYSNPSFGDLPTGSETANVEMTASIGVHVPPTAQVWFDGVPTTETGAWRTFVTPTLAGDQAFRYSVRAQWNDNGRMVEQTRRITVRAGQETDVDFTRP